MSIHIGGKQGEIAPIVLYPGDPVRAKHFAETMLEDVICFNNVRNMLGCTGRYGDKTVSIIGSGMGMSTLSIYVNEPVLDYGVQTIIRVGTTGGLQPYLKVGAIVSVMTASTDSHSKQLRFGGMDHAPAASFDLLLKAHNAAKERGIKVYVGGIFSGDRFYHEDPELWRI